MQIWPSTAYSLTIPVGEHFTILNSSLLNYSSILRYLQSNQTGQIFKKNPKVVTSSWRKQLLSNLETAGSVWIQKLELAIIINRYLQPPYRSPTSRQMHLLSNTWFSVRYDSSVPPGSCISVRHILNHRNIPFN